MRYQVSDRLSIDETKAFALVTSEWESALGLRANEIALMKLVRKGLVEMRVEKIRVTKFSTTLATLVFDTTNVREFKLKQKEDGHVEEETPAALVEHQGQVHPQEETGTEEAKSS